MSLPQNIINLLRDEAYLVLCRATVQDALDRAAEEKDEVARTRPPFGMLATKKQREVFEHSMHTVLTTESSLQNLLAKIEVLERCLNSRLRDELNDYLQHSSPDYSHSTGVLADISVWEALLPDYREQLQAFARELRSTTGAVKASATGRESFELRMHALAELHVTAAGVDRAAAALESVADRLTRTHGALFAAVTMAEPTFRQQVQWTQQMSKHAGADILVLLEGVETAVRTLLAADLAPLHASAAAARSQVSALANDYLENYWQQLRTYALKHYVEEREVDEVIAMLTERYISADLHRRQQHLAKGNDPYEGER